MTEEVSFFDSLSSYRQFSLWLTSSMGYSATALWLLLSGFLFGFGAGIYYHKGNSMSLVNQLLHNRAAAQQAFPGRQLAWLADDDMAHPVFPGKVQDGPRHVLPLVGKDLGA